MIEPLFSFRFVSEDFKDECFSHGTNECLDALLRILFSWTSDGFCVATWADIGEYAWGRSEQEAIHHLLPILRARFSDRSFTKQYRPKPFLHPPNTSSYTKKLFLQVFYFPWKPSKNQYTPPPNTPWITLPIHEKDLKHMGRLIGQDGKHFIRWTERYGLDYIWFNQTTKQIELYGQSIPGALLSEIESKLHVLRSRESVVRNE